MSVDQGTRGSSDLVRNSIMLTGLVLMFPELERRILRVWPRPTLLPAITMTFQTPTYVPKVWWPGFKVDALRTSSLSK